jgi:hypothetical protein
MAKDQFIIAGMGEPTLPDWSKGRVLNGDIHHPQNIDFVAVMSSGTTMAISTCRISIAT